MGGCGFPQPVDKPVDKFALPVDNSLQFFAGLAVPSAPPNLLTSGQVATPSPLMILEGLTLQLEQLFGLHNVRALTFDNYQNNFLVTYWLVTSHLLP